MPTIGVLTHAVELLECQIFCTSRSGTGTAMVSLRTVRRFPVESLIRAVAVFGGCFRPRW